MPGWIRKLHRWAKQYPESFASAILWATPFLAIFAYVHGGIIGYLLTILLLALIVGGTIHLGNLKTGRDYRARQIRSLIPECPCRPNYDCPDRRECYCRGSR